MPAQDLKKIEERIEKLRALINRERYWYHVENRSTMSSEALDTLKKELFDLEQKYPQFITPDSPTQRVAGKPLKEFKKVRHSVPMLSFNDAFSGEDMKDWQERIMKLLPAGARLDYYCELKIDGLAIELVYENGILSVGSTRGDGVTGEDVTQNLKTIEAIPLSLEKSALEKFPKRFVARGEVFLGKKEFEKLNRGQIKKGQKPYANPRNVAAGSVRQLDPQITASRKLNSFAYDIITDLGQKTHAEEHAKLKDLGFKTNPHNKAAKNLEEVFEFHDYWAKHRDKLPYEIDGIVVILNDNRLFAEAGVVGKAPRAAIAYKFSPKEATTIVEDIQVQVGRTGALTPVAHLRPVEVGGVTISRASLHNEDEIKRLGVKIGDTVIVARAGEVIPQIVKVLPELRPKNAGEFHLPKECPICGSPVAKEGAITRCTNPNCFAASRERLYHFASRSAFDMRGLGPKILDKFLEEDLIADPADLFLLKEGDVAVLERFGEKSARNIIDAIQGAKKVMLPRFLFALGIRHIGEESAQVLADDFSRKKSISRPRDVLGLARTYTLEDFRQIPDFGPIVAEALHEWFQDRRNQAFIGKLDAVGVRIESPKARGRQLKLEGLTFVFTGGLETISRDEAKKRVMELGGRAASSVSKEVDYVVVGREPSSKYEKAKKLGLRIIDEAKFLAMIK